MPLPTTVPVCHSLCSKFECPCPPQLQCATHSAVNLLLCKYPLKLTATTERTICQNTVLMKMYPVWIALRTEAAGRQIAGLNCKLSLTLRQQSCREQRWSCRQTLDGPFRLCEHKRCIIRERQTSLLPHARALNYVIWASPGMSRALFSIASCRGWEIAIKHYDRRLSSPYAKTLSISHRFFQILRVSTKWAHFTYANENWRTPAI
jgi:hypothetical protein